MKDFISTCDPASDFETISGIIYRYKTDDDLTFELIQFRTWLYDIGCPMSLIYRVSRAYEAEFGTYSISDVGDYQLRLIRWVIMRCESELSTRDFQDFQNALFGGQFRFIIQRMWAFRTFSSGFHSLFQLIDHFSNSLRCR